MEDSFENMLVEVRKRTKLWKRKNPSPIEHLKDALG